MFVLVLMLSVIGPSDRTKRFEWRFETAEQCVAARDWWIDHRKTHRPKGYESGWQIITLPNCYDPSGDFVRSNTDGHGRLPTS